MGLRVNKVIGWGTDTFSPKDPESFDDKREALFELSAKEWLGWISTHETEIFDIANELVSKHGRTLPACTPKYLRAWINDPDFKTERPGWCYEYDEEFGLENTIIFWPFHMHHKCCRYNDLIDWFEENDLLIKEQKSTRFVPSNCDIYPYCKGQIPYSVIATCIFLGIEDVIPDLKEALYVYWS